MEDTFISFLETIGASREIKRIFREYVKNVEEKGNELVSSSIVFPLTYKYSMFTENFQSLLEFLIANPRYYVHVLRNIILTAVNSKLEAKSLQFKAKYEQIHFVFRFENLPSTDEYKFYPNIRKSLSNFTCIMAGRDEMKLYTRHTVWQCKLTPMCENVIATEEEAIDAPKCDGCGITMKEHISLRDMSEQVTFTAYPIEMAQTPKRIGIMYQAFDVILRDDLVNFNVVLGNAYVVTGIYDGVTQSFYASNIVERPDD